jgi:hypothetical protein
VDSFEFESSFLLEDRASKVQGSFRNALVKLTLPLSSVGVSDLNFGGHDDSYFVLANRTLIMNDREIELCDIHISDYIT